MCEFTCINLADECSAVTCMQKRRTTQGLQRKTECESRSLIAMQMTRVYLLDSEVKLIKSACTHTIASSSCAGSSIVLNGKRPCRVQLFVCDTSFFSCHSRCGAERWFCSDTRRSGWQLSAPILSTALSVPSRSSRNS